MSPASTHRRKKSRRGKSKGAEEGSHTRNGKKAVENSPIVCSISNYISGLGVRSSLGML